MDRTTHISRRAIGVVALALSIGTLAACGGSTADDQRGPRTTPATETSAQTSAAPADTAQVEAAAGGLCSLVDPALVSTALGGAGIDGGEAKDGDVFDGVGCLFRATGSSAWVSVWVYQGVARDDWDATQEKTGTAQGEALDGLGDAAYRFVGTSTGLTLSAFSSGLGVTVKVAKPGITADASTAPEEIVRSLFTALG